MPLFVVAVPIGDPQDITLRAIECIKDADLVVCEELKPARVLLKRLNVEKELCQINEHNEETGPDLVMPDLIDGKKVVLISDCGTPLFADPGRTLVARSLARGIKVHPVPGASSLTAALSVSGLELKQFFYAGFLPREPSERQKEIERLTQHKSAVVLYDTPYRLTSLLTDLANIWPDSRPVVLCLALTQATERVLRGTAKEVLNTVKKDQIKDEFVLILGSKPSTEKKSNKRVKTRKRR